MRRPFRPSLGVSRGSDVPPSQDRASSWSSFRRQFVPPLGSTAHPLPCTHGLHQGNASTNQIFSRPHHVILLEDRWTNDPIPYTVSRGELLVRRSPWSPSIRKGEMTGRSVGSIPNVFLWKALREGLGRLDGVDQAGRSRRFGSTARCSTWTRGTRLTSQPHPSAFKPADPMRRNVFLRNPSVHERMRRRPTASSTTQGPTIAALPRTVLFDRTPTIPLHPTPALHDSPRCLVRDSRHSDGNRRPRCQRIRDSGPLVNPNLS